MQKKRWFMLVGVVAALFSLALLVAACDDDEDGDGNGGEAPTATEPADGVTDGETTVEVSLEDFTVNPSEAAVAAGTVTFNVTNNGTTVPHNLRVIKTDLAPAALPVDEATFMADEEQVDVVASGADLAAGGETEALTAVLDPGSYVLICNIPTHYGLGMTVAFIVE